MPGTDTLRRPIRIFPDPFRGGDNILVLSETYKPEGALAMLW